MTDLDTLRQALRTAPEPPGSGHDDLDVAAIVKHGRRLRARRRLAVAGGAACITAAAFGVLTGVSHTAGPSAPPADSGRTAPVSTVPPRNRPATNPSPAGTVAPAASPTPAGASTSPSASAPSSPTPTPSSLAPTPSSLAATPSSLTPTPPPGSVKPTPAS